MTGDTIRALARFGLAVLRETRRELADLDGGWLQDKAEECGLLHYVHVTESCGDRCFCAEYDDFPQECLREVPEVAGLDATALQSATIDDMKEHGQVVRTQEAAKYLGVSRSAMYDWIKSGLLPPPLKLGPKARGWTLRQLDEFIASRRPTSSR